VKIEKIDIHLEYFIKKIFRRNDDKKNRFILNYSHKLLMLVFTVRVLQDDPDVLYTLETLTDGYVSIRIC
jgi:hypothetical protein